MGIILGYSCPCGWSPNNGDTGYHLTTHDYKEVFKHEKNCEIYKKVWKERRQDSMIDDE